MRQLWQYLASYLYLPRLKDKEVLLATIRAGAAATDFFGYAMGLDAQGQYQGLYFGRQPGTVFDEEGSVIVTPEAARAAQARQAEAASEAAASVMTAMGGETGATLRPGASPAAGPRVTKENGDGYHAPAPAATAPTAPSAPTTFFGTVELDPLRLSTEVGQISQAVIQHLAGLLGAEVKVRLEIEAHLPGGAPDKVQRDVTENARTLKFKTAEFE